MIRRPPRSTLFPTRRSSDLLQKNAVLAPITYTLSWHAGFIAPLVSPRRDETRDRKSTRLNSKSPVHLVCRLLLEKKKKLIKTPPKILTTTPFYHTNCVPFAL